MKGELVLCEIRVQLHLRGISLFMRDVGQLCLLQEILCQCVVAAALRQGDPGSICDSAQYLLGCSLIRRIREVKPIGAHERCAFRIVDIEVQVIGEGFCGILFVYALAGNGHDELSAVI